MRIAVLADSHNRLPAHLVSQLHPADEIWHLGDVTDEESLMPLETLDKPLRVVRGNCDFHAGWPMTIDLEIAGYKIQLIHIPPQRPPTGVDLLFHGHTHVPRNERIGNTRYLNPGTVGKPNKGAPTSFAWLELDKGRTFKWEVVLL